MSTPDNWNNLNTPTLTPSSHLIKSKINNSIPNHISKHSEDSLQKMRNKFNTNFPKKNLSKRLRSLNSSKKKTKKGSKKKYSLSPNQKIKFNDSIFFNNDLINFTTIKDKDLIGKLSKVYPTSIYVINPRTSKYIYIYKSEFDKPEEIDISKLLEFQTQMEFISQNTQNKFIINFPIEEAHSLNYYLITLRLAPSLIQNFYNKVYIGHYNSIFNNINKIRYEIYDLENLMYGKELSTNNEIYSFFDKNNFFYKTQDKFRTYVMKNSNKFLKFIRYLYGKSTRHSKKLYSFDMFSEIRGKEFDYIEILLNTLEDGKFINTNINKYNKENIKEHILSYEEILNESPQYNDGEIDINKPFNSGNLNIYVERSKENIECMIIQLPQIKTKFKRNISHGLDDLLIKFLKKLYNSIYVNNTNEKKMMNNIGIVSNNRSLGYRFVKDIDNADGVLKTYQKLKNIKDKKKENQMSKGFHALLDESEYSNNESQNTSYNILSGYHNLSRQVNSYIQSLKNPKSKSKSNINSESTKKSSLKSKSSNQENSTNVLGSTASSTMVNIKSSHSLLKKKNKKDKKNPKRKTKKKKK